jgi:hypothetical protein
MVIKFNANVIKFIAKLIETYGNAPYSHFAFLNRTYKQTSMATITRTENP